MSTASKAAYQRAKEFEQEVFNAHGGTNDPQEVKRRTELAARDLQDIHTLRATEAFERYFMRRVKTKCEALERSFKYDALKPDERETVRQKMILLEDMTKLMGADEADCQRILAPDSSGPNGIAVGE